MSWFQLRDIYKRQDAWAEYWASTPPIACPRCGEPLRNGPAEQGALLFCQFDFYQYPRDYVRGQTN